MQAQVVPYPHSFRLHSRLQQGQSGETCRQAVAQVVETAMICSISNRHLLRKIRRLTWVHIVHRLQYPTILASHLPHTTVDSTRPTSTKVTMYNSLGSISSLQGEQVPTRLSKPSQDLRLLLVSQQLHHRIGLHHLRRNTSAELLTEEMPIRHKQRNEQPIITRSHRIAETVIRVFRPEEIAQIISQRQIQVLQWLAEAVGSPREIIPEVIQLETDVIHDPVRTTRPLVA